MNMGVLHCVGLPDIGGAEHRQKLIVSANRIELPLLLLNIESASKNYSALLCIPKYRHKYYQVFRTATEEI